MRNAFILAALWLILSSGGHAEPRAQTEGSSVVPSLTPAPAKVLLPTDAIVESSTEVPVVQAARAGAEGYEAFAKGAYALKNPDIYLGAAMIGNSNNSSAATQKINVFGEYGLRGGAATAESRARWTEYEVTQRQAIRTAVEAYYRYWTSVQELVLAQNYLEEMKMVQTSARERAGGRETDAVLRTGVEVARAQADVATAVQRRDADRARLNASLGRKEDPSIELPDSAIGIDIQAPADPYPKDLPPLPELLRRSESRPEVRASQQRVGAAHKNARLANLNNMPFIQILAGTDDWNLNIKSNGFQFIIGFPMLDWGSLKAERKQAWKTYEATKYLVDAAVVQAHLDVHVARSQWVSAVARQADLVGSTRKVREALDESFALFKSGVVDVDDAINNLKTWRDAFTQYLEAVGAMHIARMEVLWAAGVELRVPVEPVPAGASAPVSPVPVSSPAVVPAASTPAKPSH